MLLYQSSGISAGDMEGWRTSILSLTIWAQQSGKRLYNRQNQCWHLGSGTDSIPNTRLRLTLIDTVRPSITFLGTRTKSTMSLQTRRPVLYAY